ncbi:MAG: hypothetical protein JXB47_19625 [Anaerolineae bacterium]|nr:hypothetical protein [Anaerolineae bacterium]
MNKAWNRLWVRLLVAFLTVAGLAVITLALTVNATTEASFWNFVSRSSLQIDDEKLAELQDYYAETGS